MTTDAVKDVRSIGSRRSSPATVSDTGNGKLVPPPALLVPLVNARRHGACPHRTTPAMSVPSSSSTELSSTRMTHASVAGSQLEVPADLIRLSVGIEDCDDLRQALEQG